MIGAREWRFRPFQRTDLQACAEFAADAWPIVSNLTPDVTRLMTAYVELCRAGSTWCEVACHSERVVGLLFGRIHSAYTLRQALRGTVTSLASLTGIALGRYGRLRNPWEFVRQSVAVAAQVAQHSPPSEASVELFLVDAACRGQGVGRALMDRFVEAARAKGGKTISLYTDTLSNWQFYERYGFKRHSTFEDALNSYIAGEPMSSFVYALEVESHVHR